MNYINTRTNIPVYQVISTLARKVRYNTIIQIQNTVYRIRNTKDRTQNGRAPTPTAVREP